ncbi:MAG: methyltransferase domain-containing protein [Rhizobiaceae bacterium]|jgi:predicted TPR repeat methyltransferase|nr:methyltransferase domain-containing protein [Rhizobiaceae bacterium]
MLIDEAKLARAYNRGLKREKAGDAAGAAAAYRECLALDPEDHGGAAIRLAALGLGPVPDRASEAYVATLFSQHADVFDDILVEQLGYAVPMLMRQRLDELGLGPFQRMLDLGCGTGLAAVAMAGRVDAITGVDLAEAILDHADERELYAALYVDDAVRFCEGWDEAPFDLVTATDVLPYLGDVGPLFAGVGRCLEVNGLFALSSETLADAAFAAGGYVVGRHQRFHHAQAYLTATLARAGMQLLHAEDIVVRTDEGEPQPGHFIIARKTG